MITQPIPALNIINIKKIFEYLLEYFELTSLEGFGYHGHHSDEDRGQNVEHGPDHVNLQTKIFHNLIIFENIS